MHKAACSMRPAQGPIPIITDASESASARDCGAQVLWFVATDIRAAESIRVVEAKLLHGVYRLTVLVCDRLGHIRRM